MGVEFWGRLSPNLEHDAHWSIPDPTSYFCPAVRGLCLNVGTFTGLNSTRSNSVLFISSANTPSSPGCFMSPRNNTGWYSFRVWIISSPSPGVYSFIHSSAERCLAPAPSCQQRCLEQGRLFTPRQAGDEFWFQPGLSARVRKCQRAGQENCTKVCWLECCFGEGGGLKLIVLKDNRAGDFPTKIEPDWLSAVKLL